MTAITLPRAVVEQALETLLKSHTCPLLPDDCEEAIAALRAALAQQAEPAQDQDVEDAIEAAYWQFDCRKKGLNEWASAPQSERDAFKAEARKLVRGYFPTRQAQDTKREMLAVADAFIRGKRAALAQQAEPTGKKSLQVESVVAENATTQQQIEQTPPSEYRRGYWAGFAIGKREGRIEAEDALAQQAEPVEPYCYVYEYDGAFGLHREFYPKVYNGHKPDRTVPLYTAPPQRKPLTDEEIDRATAQARDALLDHIYEYGTAAEGELERIRKLCRAVERAHGIKE